jgi:hypothetical protein
VGKCQHTTLFEFESTCCCHTLYIYM